MCCSEFCAQLSWRPCGATISPSKKSLAEFELQHQWFPRTPRKVVKGGVILSVCNSSPPQFSRKQPQNPASEEWLLALRPKQPQGLHPDRLRAGTGFAVLKCNGTWLTVSSSAVLERCMACSCCSRCVALGRSSGLGAMHD